MAGHQTSFFEKANDSDDEVVVATHQRQKRKGHKRHIRLRHPPPD
jgi:hypothetical protein